MKVFQLILFALVSMFVSGTLLSADDGKHPFILSGQSNMQGLKPKNGGEPENNGALYDRLMKKVRPAIEGPNIATVTFLWMQGERDAKEKHGSVYESSLKGLNAELADGLGCKEVNLVIGRFGDFGLTKIGYADWEMVREAQVKIAEDAKRGAWMGADDLTDKPARSGEGKRDDLHCTQEGYVTVGERLDAKAISLIEERFHPSF